MPTRILRCDCWKSSIWGKFRPDVRGHVGRDIRYSEWKKIKKETYAFFLVKSVDLLKPGGRLCFVCSDTILTIPTMSGLRSWLQERCHVEISEVPGQFVETAQQLVLISLVKQCHSTTISIFGRETKISDVELTPNYSWGVDREHAKYFRGPLLGDKLVATSGMTTGNNRLFLRKIEDGAIVEPYEFAFVDEPITLHREVSRARHGRLSEARYTAVVERQRRGDTMRVVRSFQRESPVTIRIPHSDYRYYNKATSAIVYERPRWVIFWRDNGEYVYTYKKSGKWYLHGVGGRPYFGKEGLTWSLISSRLRTRWLPGGRILDSGAPCAFLRRGVHREELFFILGWTLTELCTSILKSVINHTRNIQSKDFERLPYPFWVAERTRTQAIAHVTELVRRSVGGECFSFDSAEVSVLNAMYAYRMGFGRDRKTKGPCDGQRLLGFVDDVD